MNVLLNDIKRSCRCIGINGNKEGLKKQAVLFDDIIEAQTNGHCFAADIFRCIFMNENIWLSINISLKFVPKVQINNVPALVWIMACHQTGDKPLSEPILVKFADAYMRH